LPMEQFRKVFGQPRVAIGVIHLVPLPGSPGFTGDFDSVARRAIAEATMLEAAGFNGLIVENFGDMPFLKEGTPAETVASMAIVAREIVQSVNVPVGVNVLRNDFDAALAVAATSGCRFVRLNVLVGAYIATEGLIEGRPGEVHRRRQALNPEILILADVMVKHAYRIGETDICDDALDVAERGRADCLIITGRRTGSPPDGEDLKRVRTVLEENNMKVPLLVGSGVTPANAEKFLKLADGFIVSSYLREGGKAGEALDAKRLKEFKMVLEEVSRKTWAW